MAEGMLPAQVQQTLEIEKQVNLQLRKIDGAIAIVEARVAELNAQENQTEAVKAEVALLEQKLGLLRAAKGEIQATGQAAAAGAADANSPANRLQGEVNKAQGRTKPSCRIRSTWLSALRVPWAMPSPRRSRESSPAQ